MTKPPQLPELSRSHRLWVGSLRQEILASLDDARASCVGYVGGRPGTITTSYSENVHVFCNAAGWESAGHAAWRLPTEV
jgi:hypothetical protein